MNYRPEIDGLRALAVVPVILFHGGFDGFGGGFVGVDVFFVISGFLITEIIAFDLERDQFSLLTFYERRARRILPALFVVVIFCIPFAWAWLVPRDLVDFSQSVISVMTFSSNILFWQESGYFSTSAELKPLLHTWSLALEEQFYVFFPLLLWAIWLLGKRALLVLLTAVLLASLSLAEWAVVHEPVGAFYLLPTRGWELMIGALAALVVRAGWMRFPRSVEEAMGIAGLALIFYAVMTFDNSTPFPGKPALVPTLGALLLILPTSVPTMAQRLLSLTILVRVGLVSYSAYLWHQPLFAFARYQSLGKPSEVLMLSLAVLSFGLAWLSWRFVEIPFRNRARVSRLAVFWVCAVLGGALCLVGALGWIYNGFPSRLNMPDSIISSMSRSNRVSECFDRKGLHKIEDWTCPLGDPDAKPQFLVFGDSHALSMLDAFDEVARNEGISGHFSGASGCTPFIGVFALRSDQKERNCHEANARVLRHVRDHSIRRVILVARWTYYTNGGYSGDGISYIARSPEGERTLAESRAAFEHGLRETLRLYREAAVELIIVAQIPEQTHDPMLAYGRAYLSNRPGDFLSQVSISYEKHRSLQSYVDNLFTSNNATVVDFTDIFCEGEVCSLGTTESSYYFDSNHLSVAGAARLVPALTNLMPSLTGQ